MDAFHRTEYYQERVNTHSANGNYTFSSWQDKSEQLTGLEHYLLTKVKCDKIWTYYDKETEIDYEREKNAFKSRNDLDAHQDFWFGIDIDGYKSHLLAEVSPGVKPQFLDVPWYWLCSILTMSVFFRHWFDSIVGRKKYTFVKEIRK